MTGEDAPGAGDLDARLARIEAEVARLSDELEVVRAFTGRAPVEAPVAQPSPPVERVEPAPPVAPEPVRAERLPPLPPLPPPPPPKPPKPPRRSVGELARDWDLVGARGFAVAGGAVMALGIGLFFILAANRGWIDERARVALGALASAAVFGAGLLLRRRYGQYWSALAAVGAGIAGAYATLAAAAARYDLVPDALALPLAGVIAGIGTVVAIRWRSQIIAVLGLLGAALAPALQAIDTGLSWTSAAFALIVLVAAAVVAVPRGWLHLLTTIAGVVGLQVLALAADTGAPPDAGPVAVAALFALTLLLIGVALQLASRRIELDVTALSYALSAFGSALALTLLLYEERDERGTALLVATGVWALVAGALGVRRQPDLALAVGVSALGLAAGGSAFLLTDSGLVVAWAVESVVLTVLAWRFGDARLQTLAIVYATLAAARALDTDGDPRLLFEVDGDHRAAVLPLGAAAIAALAAGLVWPRAYRPRTEGGLLAFVGVLRQELERLARGLRETFVFAGLALATLTVSFALVAASFDTGHVVATALAAALGALLLVYAARVESDPAVAASLTWLGVVLAEALAFDSELLGEGEVGPGGWSVLAAAAGVVAGTYALHVLQPAREEWDFVSGIGAGVGLVSWSLGLADITDSDTGRGAGLLVAAVVYAGLAAFVLRREGLRTFATVLWALGLAALLAAERLFLDSDVLFAIAVAATGAAVAALAGPVREERLWLGGGAAVWIATAYTLVVLTPPSHFFSASENPGRALAALVVCALALGALTWLAPGESERLVAGITGGGIALYAVSLVILEVAVRVSSASIETDFERGHTAVSGLWALIGLTLLVLGLLRRSAALRYGGLALFGLSLAKIFLYDLAELSSVARAFSFIFVGGLLLAGGFFLQRLSDRMAPRA
jgi:hypothetical protein